MSESNDNGNPGGQDENILDDMMQNNVSFDEDVVDKPAKTADDDEKESDTEGNDNSKNDQSAEKDNHSDISEDDSEDSPSSDDDETDAKDEKSKRSSSKSPSKKLEENHSDISEEEDENFGKDKAGAAESNANNEKKEETVAKLKKSRERDDSNGSIKDSEDEEESPERKKPALASRISKPTQQRQSSSSPKRKKGKSYDYATKLNYLFRDARFFLVKSSVSENVSLSKVRGVWSTPPANETRFNKAYKESRNVLLVFSVKESGKFCGLARLATESRRDVPRVPWILPPGLSANALGGVFKIDWICKKDLTFQKVQHLHNPWNENKPVKIGRDGQEIEPSVAEELCRLFPVDQEIDMTPILRRSKESARRQRSRPESEKVQDIPHSRPLADRIRPNVHHDNPRKRPHDRIGNSGRGRGGHRDNFNGPPRSKYGRKSSPPPPSRRDQGGRDRGGNGNRNRLPSYEEYIRSVTRGSNPSRSSGGGAGRSRDDDYLYERRNGRPSYERSVESFLRRTGEIRRYRR